MIFYLAILILKKLINLLLKTTTSLNANKILKNI